MLFVNRFQLANTSGANFHTANLAQLRKLAYKLHFFQNQAVSTYDSLSDYGKRQQKRFRKSKRNIITNNLPALDLSIKDASAAILKDWHACADSAMRHFRLFLRRSGTTLDLVKYCYSHKIYIISLQTVSKYHQN